MKEPLPAKISARPPDNRSTVANCWYIRTGSSELRTVTALESLMLSARTAAALIQLPVKTQGIRGDDALLFRKHRGLADQLIEFLPADFSCAAPGLWIGLIWDAMQYLRRCKVLCPFGANKVEREKDGCSASKIGNSLHIETGRLIIFWQVIPGDCRFIAIAEASEMR